MTLADAIPLSGGRTNTVWRQGDEVWKRYDTSKTTPLFANDADAEWYALQSLAGLGIAPQPLKRVTDETGDHLVYRYEPGETHQTPLTELARVLGLLHRHPAPDALPHAATGDALIAMGRAMGAGSETLMRNVPPAPEGTFAPAFCHRDPVPGNVVQNRPRRETD